MSATIDTMPLRVARDATRHLTLQEKAQLLAELANEIAQDTREPKATSPQDGLGRYQAFTAAFRATYPTANVSDQLDADRSERERGLLGS